jgi:hypothetical protein
MVLLRVSVKKPRTGVAPVLGLTLLQSTWTGSSGGEGATGPIHKITHASTIGSIKGGVRVIRADVNAREADEKTTPDDPRARRTVNPPVEGLRRIAASDGAVLGRLGPFPFS